MTGSPAGKSSAAVVAEPAAIEQRVSVITADRLCTGCGYNLTGQAVLREPHYHLLIVRCPECATVACVQDYPWLGRWANRWAVIAAVAWFALLSAIALGTTGGIVGSTYGFTWIALESYDQLLSEQHRQWVATLHPDKDTSQFWRFEGFEEWWVTQDPQAVFAGAGGWAGVVEWVPLLLYLVPISAAFVVGCVFAVALMHRRRGSLALVAVALAAIGITGVAIAWWQLASVEEVERGLALWLRPGMHLFSAALLLVWTAALCGLLFGRSVARRLIRALLAPRLRIPLARLWTCDGLAPPIGAAVLDGARRA